MSFVGVWRMCEDAAGCHAVRKEAKRGGGHTRRPEDVYFTVSTGYLASFHATMPPGIR